MNANGVSDAVFGKDIDVPLYTSGIFGLILVLTMLFRPEGLIPSSRRRAEFHEGVARTSPSSTTSSTSEPWPTSS